MIFSNLFFDGIKIFLESIQSFKLIYPALFWLAFIAFLTALIKSIVTHIRLDIEDKKAKIISKKLIEKLKIK